MAELDWYDDAELGDCAKARILLTGDAKAGKTTAVLTSAPTPIAVLNCDGAGAPMAAKRHGATGLKVLDVSSSDMWFKGVESACRMARDGQVETIVVDTITMLVNNVLALEFGAKYEGFEIWRKTLEVGLRAMNKLLMTPAHVFIVSHYQIEDGQLALSGKLKATIPALVHDRIHLEFDPKKNPSRFFHIGPSASGLSGGRHSSESKTVVADIKVLLKELGYQF